MVTTLRRGEVAGTVFVLAISISSCTKAPPETEVPLAVKGKRTYLANCIACHNADPTKDGPIGPAVAGSSLELLKARVLEATYPPGYTPKRQSKAMAPLPQLKDQLEALHAFLNTPGT